MRTTEVRCAQHLMRAFKAKWLIQGRRRINDTGAEAVLAAKGIQVLDPKEVLSPAFVREKIELPKLPRQEIAPTAPSNNAPCHVITNRFAPVVGMAQVQNITNSLVRNSLPDSVLENATANTPEEDERVKEAILHAHLLDSYQKKLPRMIDVKNNPGWVFPREYGIPVNRKNKSLTYQLLLLLDQVVPAARTRHLVEDTLTRVTLNHSEQLIQMEMRAAFLLSSPKPLAPVLSPADIKALEGQVLPDLYPISPFINCRPRTQYSVNDAYGVSTSRLSPHTIIIHHNQPRMRLTQDQFYAMSLLHAFTHASSYAKNFNKVDHLAQDPVTVQVIHLNGLQCHLGVFQLNTLDLNGASKNVFFTQPWEQLFGTCCFRGAKPMLEGYNPRVFSLLKGMYASV